MINDFFKKYNKYKWWIFGFIVFLYPFYCLLIGEIRSFGELYTFGLSLKDFMPIWIALGGSIGVVSNIILTRERITSQEKQQKEQQKQFEVQISKQNEQIQIQEEQQKDQQKQFEVQISKQNEQIQIQQKQLLNTRFSSGVELLGNENESTRIGGVYSLYFLAKEHPTEYAETVCEILCAHIRTKTSDRKYQEEHTNGPSDEIRTILDIFFIKDCENDKPIFKDRAKNFRGIFLREATFEDATLSNIYFREAQLSDVKFPGVKLNWSNFWKAKISNVGFEEGKISNVRFEGAEFGNVTFKKTEFIEAKFEELKLGYVCYPGGDLRGVNFLNAEFSNVDFSGAKSLKPEIVNFEDTKLAGYDFDEITRPGRSLKLTKTDDTTDPEEN